MLAVLKDVYRETIATTTEMVSTIKVLVVHVNTFNSWLSISRRISITNSGLASVLSAKNKKMQQHSHIVSHHK